MEKTLYGKLEMGVWRIKLFPWTRTNWSSTKQFYNTRIKVGISRKSIYKTFSVLIFVYIELHFLIYVHFLSSIYTFAINFPELNYYLSARDMTYITL